MDIYPALRYRDARAAIEWLERAFGLETHAAYEGPDGTIAHAELRHGDGMIMLGSEGETPGALGHHAGHGWQYMVVDDPDAHLERSRAGGAEIVMELRDTEYGSREY